MTNTQFLDQILNTWRVHNRINLYLLEEIPQSGFAAVPSHSICNQRQKFVIEENT